MDQSTAARIQTVRDHMRLEKISLRCCRQRALIALLNNMHELSILIVEAQLQPFLAIAHETRMRIK